MAGAGDIVLIAGKGHEDYQIFKDRTIAFDERAIVKKYLK
jgi:UDP-N-acetylmuramoyl-L-alanyl-D-glutamate--2,6-diaminopimelate ligase